MKIAWPLSPSVVAHGAVSHWEKGVFGLAFLFLLVCVVQASRRESLSWSPDALMRITQTAEAHLQATAPSPIRVVPYAEIASRSRRPISAPSYALAAPFDPPVWQIAKRSVPDVYPVRELLASAGRGAFVSALGDTSSEYALRDTEGERWACLTGVIEYYKQAEAFRDALLRPSYHDPRRDQPDYVYFRVERAEADPRRPEAAPEWIRQNVRQMFLHQQSWSRYATDPVDPRYLPPERSGISLAFPLGPREDRPWGPEVCHPRIPLQPTPSAGQAGVPRRFRVSREAAGAQDVAQDTSEEPEFLLFRYFDYNVAPGRQYRYRVRLLLANPNYAVPCTCLEDEGSAEIRYLETEWSQPTDIVRIAPDTGVLAGPARTWGARARVMMTKFLMSTGEVAFEEFPVRRGQLLDFANRVFHGQSAPMQVAQLPFATSEMSSPASLARTAARGFNRPTESPPRGVRPGAQAVTYSSGMLLLDVRGGARMSGPDRFTEPASLLLMDRLGNLVVRDEMGDRAAYRSFQRAANPPEATYVERKAILPGRGAQMISLE